MGTKIGNFVERNTKYHDYQLRNSLNCHFPHFFDTEEEIAKKKSNPQGIARYLLHDFMNVFTLVPSHTIINRAVPSLFLQFVISVAQRDNDCRFFIFRQGKEFFA